MPKPISSLLSQSLDKWQAQYGTNLSTEDGREILSNMTAFFDLLMEWDDRKNHTEAGETE